LCAAGDANVPSWRHLRYAWLHNAPEPWPINSPSSLMNRWAKAIGGGLSSSSAQERSVARRRLFHVLVPRRRHTALDGMTDSLLHLSASDCYAGGTASMFSMPLPIDPRTPENFHIKWCFTWCSEFRSGERQGVITASSQRHEMARLAAKESPMGGAIATREVDASRNGVGRYGHQLA
jgi:hypothetical protein